MSRTRSISNKIYGIERRLCLGFFALAFVLLALYGYFVGKSIINVVVREEVEIHIAEVNSRISDLESSYIAKKNAINLDFAYAQGFKAVGEKTFVNRGTLVGRISQNNEI